MTTTPAPTDLDTLRALEKAANPAPWFFNGYSAIFSKTMNDGYDGWIEPLVDANHSLDRSACPPCDGKACQYATEQYHRDPAVAWVPAHHGDTAIDKRVADAQLIEAMRNNWTALLDELAEARRERDVYRHEVGHADAEREEAERNRDAAREELARSEHARLQFEESATAWHEQWQSTRAELEQAKAQRNLAIDWLETSAELSADFVQREIEKSRDEFAATRCKVKYTHRLPLSGRERVADCWLGDSHDGEHWEQPTDVKWPQEANPAATAEPATEHTVWDHYGPCGYCGVTTGPCLNPDDTAPWPVERRVPAPKPHSRRQLAATTAEPAGEPFVAVGGDKIGDLVMDALHAMTPREISDRIRSQPCLTCGVPAGEQCRSQNGPRAASHVERLRIFTEAMRAQVVAEPADEPKATRCPVLHEDGVTRCHDDAGHAGDEHDGTGPHGHKTWTAAG